MFKPIRNTPFHTKEQKEIYHKRKENDSVDKKVLPLFYKDKATNIREVQEKKEQAEKGEPRLYDKLYDRKYNKPYTKLAEQPTAKSIYKNNFVNNKPDIPKPKYDPNPTYQPVVDLQVYQPHHEEIKRDPLGGIHPSLYKPITTNDPNVANMKQVDYMQPGLSAMTNYMPYGLVPNYDIPIVKNYNVNVQGPFLDHTKVANIYEDMLPFKDITKIYNSVEDRITVYDFVRNTLIDKTDGEKIELDGSSKNSLLSFIKFLEMDKNYGNNANPYSNLPNGFIIYNSCYPITYEGSSSAIVCAKESLGINVRIYRQTEGEANAVSDSKYNHLDYDTWREIRYYEYVRDHIIKRKVCPNFTLMYCYYVSKTDKIDFNSIHSARVSAAKSIASALKSEDTVYTYDATGKIDSTQQSKYNGDMIIALTEAPNYNLANWGNPLYSTKSGNTHTMMSTGFHTKNEQMSIIFQIIAAFITMYAHKIVYMDIDISKCIYIKDLKTSTNSLSYWIYIIDGVEFYVPNYGYAALVDSSFADLTSDDTYKLYSPNIYDDHRDAANVQTKSKKINNSTDRDSYMPKYNEKCLENIKTILDKLKALKDKASLNGDVSTKVTNMNKALNTDNTIANVNETLLENMNQLLNNRIGTYLKQTEVDSIMKSASKDFTRGQIIVHEVEHDTYKFVLYLLDNGVGTHKIYTKDDKNNFAFNDKISDGLLFPYSRNNTILQDMKDGMSFNEEGLIETYHIYTN